MSWSRNADLFGPLGPLGARVPGSRTLGGSTMPGEVEPWSHTYLRGMHGDRSGPPQCLLGAALPSGIAHVNITEADLLKFVGRTNPANTVQAGVFKALVAAAGSSLWFHEISRSALRLCHFLGQCRHESGQFISLVEGFHYSTEAGLKDAFGDRLTAEERTSFLSRPQKERHAEVETDYVAKNGKATKPEQIKELAALKTKSNEDQAALQIKLANKVYNGRMGNKVGTNDGYNYRGRGIIQLTGRDNYANAGTALDLPLVANPGMVAEPETALRTAVWFWTTNKLNDHADADDALKVGQAINLGPGKVGSKTEPKAHDERVAYTDAAKAIWGTGLPE